MSSAKRMTTRLKRFAKIMLGRELYLRTEKKVPTEKHGGEYGGWVICPSHVTEESIVYSLGVGTDVSFDLSIIEKYGMNVYAFDPTPQSIEWVNSQNLPQEFKFYEYGVADYNGMATFYPPNNPDYVSHTILARPTNKERAIVVPVRTLQSVMRELGHKKIDILKMNIEGAEYAIIEDMIKDQINVIQLLLEFHHRFADIPLEQTKKSIRLLNQHGYKIFHISDRGKEYSFIRS